MQQILDYLYAIALKKGIAIATTKDLAPETPSLSLNSRKTIIVNMNWYNTSEIPFIIAHELSHMLNDDSGVLYYSTSSAEIAIEGAANKKAISMLINYAKMEDANTLNPVQFMEQFGIPSKFEDIVINQLNLASTI